MNSLSFSEILRRHAADYPQMEPCDAVKLVYQSEFGGGHLIRDEKASLAFLEEELAATRQDDGARRFEPIGDGKARLHLAAVKQLPSVLVNRIFCASARRTRGSRERFDEKLAVLEALAADGIFSFSAQALSGYLAEYRRMGCPAVRHSGSYRRTYHPAYRVVDERYETILPLLTAVERALGGEKPVRVGIDGGAAAGKTTAAALVAAAYDCNVIHMDDFFLPPELRTEARFAEPGGNVDYERFAAEVAAPLQEGRPFSYGIFDCSVMRCTARAEVIPKRLTVVEGAYSLHPRFGALYDVRAFMRISPEEQKRRILQRNGEELWRRFEGHWIPMERLYFETFAIPRSCAVLIDAE